MELLIILALAFGAMWFMSRKTRMQQKTAANFRANLAPGQEVMTGSGLFATIVAVEDDVVTLETSPGVESRWLRPAIAKLVEPPVAADDDAEDDDLYEDDELEDDELEDELDDDALENDEVEHDATDADPQDETHVDVPDDASSLTNDPDEDTPRR